MNVVKKQNVIIKGTKDGLTLHLDDTCSFHDVLNELERKLSSNQYGGHNQLVSVQLRVGNRYLTPDQEEQIKSLVRSKNHLVVESIESNVVSKEEALKIKQQNEIVSVARVVRSGQVLHVEGDLLLIGDVNPGGTVIAGGNIFVLGVLKGIAHAGYYGNDQAVISASKMEPTQLRICEAFSRAEEADKNEEHDMECAYLDEDKRIVIERSQLMSHLRPNLTRLERRS
ncbi:septum site-determining protein MinC [Priestia filamentosa]|uniref:Probable septum site-determining protein MinC n=1 Tax=Priestia filamentosa TaxID=1402861 RepID=A0A0H4KJM0_9BACI|nr:septum site-determining protein MinC [Priestia filamentosa]AKO94282.1 septum site-determining protein MinC [Priestia filamentosa]MDT3764562.1 septum site-determining protein MinC [Priestia filamentosa]OXS70988.1 septum site-determining protein MinC [Priestia filamentosa]RJS66623.1 septum site-determining protein MinC [Priestia filamentosa]WCM15174.1 septum site-determining protein MinC [Priestia filamentosa]